MRKFNRLLRQEDRQGDFDRMKEVIDKLFNKKTMPYEINYGEATRALFSCDSFKDANKNLNMVNNIDADTIKIGNVTIHIGIMKETWKGYVEQWLDFAEFLDKAVYKWGYRGRDILTMQEHKLIGSTWNTGVKITMENAHIPIGVLAGNMEIGEARLGKEVSAILNNVGIGKYFLAGQEKGCIALETLGDDGKTIHDPRLVDFGVMDGLARKGLPLAEAIEKSIINAVKKEGLPYSRD